MMYRVPRQTLESTFTNFRNCGKGKRECQALWISSWRTPDQILGVVHPRHRAHAQGFDVDSSWLNSFWVELADSANGIRVQVHTHPVLAFHSATDDAYPIIHTPGFLSLVIPNFAMGPSNLEGAYLAEISPNGTWLEVECEKRLQII